MAALLVAVLGGIDARGRYRAWSIPDGAREPRREVIA
jgi:hypothetical protein